MIFLVCTYFGEPLNITHPDQRAVTKMRFNDMASLYFFYLFRSVKVPIFISVKVATEAKALSSDLTFLQKYPT